MSEKNHFKGLGCRFATIDEDGNYRCSVCGSCAFMIPSDESCYNLYGEGPIAFTELCNDRKTLLNDYLKRLNEKLNSGELTMKLVEENIPNQWRIMNDQRINIEGKLEKKLVCCESNVDFFDSMFEHEEELPILIDYAL